MACPDYEKLKQECETHRKQLSEFHCQKTPGWQKGENTVRLLRAKQKAILDAQRAMDWHMIHCRECNRSRPQMS
jgi:hypothetical protein